MLTDVEQEALTDEQRMEEGRRMFQIFAARMFEQRVLQAYREKVSFSALLLQCSLQRLMAFVRLRLRKSASCSSSVSSRRKTTSRRSARPSAQRRTRRRRTIRSA